MLLTQDGADETAAIGPRGLQWEMAQCWLAHAEGFSS